MATASYREPPATASKPTDTEDEQGVTVAELRAALQLRFGDLIARMEKRGLLCLDQAEGDTKEPGDAVCLVADEIEPGEEVAAMLYECGGEATLQDMLGDRQFAELAAAAQDLADANDIVAVRAETRIPDDAKPADLDSWLLACTIQVAAEQAGRPMANSDEARKLLVSALGAVRAWWAKTATSKTLARYGQDIQLSPQDVGALVVQAMDEGEEDGPMAPRDDMGRFVPAKESAA